MRLDRLYNVDPERVRYALGRWIEKLPVRGADRAEIIVTSTAMAFILCCERFAVSPRRALEVAERVARDRNPLTFRALRTYLREELRD